MTGTPAGNHPPHAAPVSATLDSLPLGPTDQKVADLLVSSGRLDESAIERATQESLARPSLSLIDSLVVLKLLPLREAQVVHDRALGRPLAGPIGAPPGLTGRGTDWTAAAAGFRSMWISTILIWAAAALATIGILASYESVASTLARMSAGEISLSLEPIRAAFAAGLTAILLGTLAKASAYMMFLAGLGTVASAAPTTGGMRALASISGLFLAPALVITILAMLALSLFGLSGATLAAVQNYLSLDRDSFRTLATIVVVVWGLADVAALVGAVFFVWLLLRMGHVFGSLRLPKLVWGGVGTLLVGILAGVLAVFPGAATLGNEGVGITLLSGFGLMIVSSIFWYAAFRECHELVRPN